MTDKAERAAAAGGRGAAMDLAAFGQPVLADAVKLCQKHKLRALKGTWKEYLEVATVCRRRRPAAATAAAAAAAGLGTALLPAAADRTGGATALPCRRWRARRAAARPRSLTPEGTRRW
jgi:hypothetical protein